MAHWITDANSKRIKVAGNYGSKPDSELSETSENAVQNKVVTEALNKKLSNERVLLYSTSATSFAGQKISFDATQYNYFQILWRLVGNATEYKTETIPRDYITQSSINLLWDTILKRNYTLESTGITFATGTQITGYATSGPVSNNNVMIPTHIYGVK